MDITIILPYGFLLLAVISLWSEVELYKKYFLWLALTAVAFLFALIFGRANLIALTYTISLGVITYYYFKEKNVFHFLFSNNIARLCKI